MQEHVGADRVEQGEEHPEQQVAVIVAERVGGGMEEGGLPPRLASAEHVEPVELKRVGDAAIDQLAGEPRAPVGDLGAIQDPEAGGEEQGAGGQRRHGGDLPPAFASWRAAPDAPPHGFAVIDQISMPSRRSS